MHMEILEGSYGGRQGMDGMDAVDTLYANTRNNPIEDIESHLPLRVNRYELRDQRAGQGKWRGGIGSVREFTFLADGAFSVEGEGHKYRPWGFAGGEDGSTASLVAAPRDRRRSGAAVEGALSRREHGRPAASRLGPNGGGYGDPFERDPAGGAERHARRLHHRPSRRAPTMASSSRGQGVGRGRDRRASRRERGSTAQ